MSAAPGAEALPRPRPVRPRATAWAPPIDELLRFCYSRLHSRPDAEDAAQETLLRWLNLARKRRRPPTKWFIKVASNVCHEVLRGRQRDTAGGLGDLEAQGPVDPAQLAVANVWLQALMERLDPQDRIVLSSLYLDDRLAADLARELNLSPSGVRMAAMRARQRARDAVDHLGGPGGLLPSLGAGLSRVRRGARNRLERARNWYPSQLPDLSAFIGGAPAVIGLGTAALIIGGATGNLGAPHYFADRPAAATVTPNGPPVSPSTVAASSDGAVDGPGHAGQSAPSPTPSGPGWFVQSVVAPGQGASQQDATFTSFTPSPHYQSDHTVFASGVLGNRCSSACDTLFASRDGGASWQHLPSAGYLDNQVLLPPTYPADPEVFGVGPAGLQASSNAGTNFSTLVPQVATAAIAPDSATGNAAIMLGEVPLVILHAGDDTVSPGPVLPPGVLSIDGLAYVGDTNHLLIAAKLVSPSGSGGQGEAVLACDVTACSTAFTTPTATAISFAVSPTVNTDDTVVAFSTAQAWISRDQGASFSRLTLPVSGGIPAVAMAANFASSGQLVWAGVSADSASASVPGQLLFFSSRDAGVGFTRVAATGLPGGVALKAFLALPGGALLGAIDGPTAVAKFGIRCSHDWGATWTPTC